MMERDTFIFHKEWFDAVKDLDAETKAQVFETICRFALFHEKEIPNIPMVRMAMAFITPVLEQDFMRWQKTKESRSEAANARWSKQDNANACKSMQMHANANFAMQSDANDAVNVNDYVNVNNSSFCALSRMNEEEKKKLIFEITKKMLRKGIVHPYAEANKFFDHNDSTGWMLSNGKKITNPIAFAEGWESKSKPNAFIAKTADSFLRILEAAGIEDPAVMNGFYGIEIEGNTAVIVHSKNDIPNAIEKAMEDPAKFERVKLAVQMCSEGVSSLIYKHPRA